MHNDGGAVNLWRSVALTFTRGDIRPFMLLNLTTPGRRSILRKHYVLEHAFELSTLCMRILIFVAWPLT